MTLKSTLQSMCLVGWLFYLSLGKALGTTVPNPSIRYTISSQTNQRVTAFMAIESDDPAFSTSDTVRVMTGFQEGLLVVHSPRGPLKPYQRLIILTEQQPYQTPIVAFDDPCRAYLIQITQTGLSIREDYSFRLRKWTFEILIVCLLTFVIKGAPLLLVAAPHLNKVYVPFTVLNGLFIACFLVLRHYSFGRPVQAGPIEIKVYYSVLLVITLLECFWYSSLVSEARGRTRLVASTIIGSLLWVFPGFLLTVFALFLFAHC